MSTLDQQIEQSVVSITEDASKLREMIQGTDTQTIDTVNGVVDSISKVIKDNKEKLDNSISDVTTKAQQVSDDRTAVSQIKSEVEEIKNNYETTIIPPINSQINSINSVLNTHTFQLSQKAPIDVVPIAGGVVYGDLTTEGMFGIKSFTRTSTGRYDFTVDDDIASLDIDVITTPYKNFRNIAVVGAPSGGTFHIAVGDVYGNHYNYANDPFVFRVYKRRTF